MPIQLSPRERSFISYYLGKAGGNGARAAELAGYAKGSAKVTASRLLTRDNVKRELERRLQERERTSKATAEERDEVLTTILRDPKKSTLNRIIAIKELNKVDGRHTVRHQLEGKITLEMALAASREV